MGRAGVLPNPLVSRSSRASLRKSHAMPFQSPGRQMPEREVVPYFGPGDNEKFFNRLARRSCEAPVKGERRSPPRRINRP